jgi:hypothetical protein
VRYSAAARSREMERNSLLILTSFNFIG